MVITHFGDFSMGVKDLIKFEDVSQHTNYILTEGECRSQGSHNNDLG